MSRLYLFPFVVIVVVVVCVCLFLNQKPRSCSFCFLMDGEYNNNSHQQHIGVCNNIENKRERERFFFY